MDEMRSPLMFLRMFLFLLETYWLRSAWPWGWLTTGQCKCSLDAVDECLVVLLRIRGCTACYCFWGFVMILRLLLLFSTSAPPPLFCYWAEEYVGATSFTCTTIFSLPPLLIPDIEDLNFFPYASTVMPFSFYYCAGLCKEERSSQLGLLIV